MKGTFSQGNEKEIFLYYTPDEEEGGRGFAHGHACGVRVDGAAPRGLWPPVGGGLCIASLRGQKKGS